MSSLVGRWRQRRSGERGATLVEFAIIAPVLSMLIFGMIEYGLLFRDYLTVSNVTRTGARVGSAAGNQPLADYNILQAVKAAAGALPGGVASIDKIIVYKTTSADGAPPAACITGGSQSGSCNVYLKADAAWNLPTTSFGCGAGSVDLLWCPTTSGYRSVSQANASYIGVWVTVNHKFMTGFFGSAKTITDSVVMRMEPKDS
jgi:hypothetical protein